MLGCGGIIRGAKREGGSVGYTQLCVVLCAVEVMGDYDVMTVMNE